MGLLLVVVVHCAGIQDYHGVKLVMMKLLGRFPRLQRLWADGGYNKGALGEWIARFAGWTLEIVPKLAGQQGFVVLPRRWVVERTFAWRMKFRRLRVDYEEKEESSEAWIRLAMIHIMVRRLAATT